MLVYLDKDTIIEYHLNYSMCPSTHMATIDFLLYITDIRGSIHSISLSKLLKGML